jgi:two-component system sensor histidine kinase KdpD
MDLDAILRRHPKVCLVDGLAYDNPPGSRNSKRWEDVEQLLDAGISVITSVNLQHIEETQPSVERITGKQVHDTIPKRFLMGADEIVIVDAPPDLTEDGASDPGRQQRLSQLRELALILAAEVVDHQLEKYLEHNGIPFQWGTQERILVCITPKTNAAKIIESGRRNAERFHGELYVAHVEQPQLTKEDEAALERNLAIARQAGARIKILDGEDPIDAIVKFARAEGVTQIFIGHSQRKSWWQRLAGSPVDDLIRAAGGIDVRVFPH